MTTYLPGICNMLFSVDDISFDVKTYCKRLLIDITNILARDIFFFYALFRLILINGRYSFIDLYE